MSYSSPASGQLEHLPCIHRTTFSCASPDAAPDLAGTTYVMTYVGQVLRDQRRIAAVMASERPTAEATTPLALCVPQLREWANSVGPSRFGSAAIFIVDRYGAIDLWDERQGGFTPVEFAGQPDRSVESLVRSYRGGLALWVQHAATLGMLEADGCPSTNPSVAVAEPLPANVRPMVGLGTTIVHGRAMVPATIYRLEREGARVGVRRDLVDEVVQYAGQQAYAFVAHPLSALEWFVAEPDGAWVSEQEPRLQLHVGTRNLRAA